MEKKHITTGIYKYPVHQPILLEKEDVANDIVVDRKNHGGIDKACYLFGANNYKYWKYIYPNLEWDWGMFGENLTLDHLDESKIRIGNIYKIGQAIVQITQPREPCFKLGIRFKNQNILKEFITHQKPGTYVKVLEKGIVQPGDTLELIEESKNTLTVALFYRLLYMKNKDPKLVELAITNKALPLYKREELKRYK